MADRVKILIVEDEAATILELQDRLESLDYSVPGFATRGQGAMRHIEQDRPDLVLMDIRLQGGMDGIETAGVIRRLYDIPVIFITAHADHNTLSRARLAEPFGYLLKPFTGQELQAAIEMALYKHGAEQALKESERRLRLYADGLETLHQIDQAILDAGSLEAVARPALRFLEQLVPCPEAYVVTLDCQASEAAILAICNGGETTAISYPLNLLPESEYCQKLASGNIQIIDRDGLARWFAEDDLSPAWPMPFYIGVPLLKKDTLLGALNLGVEEPDALSQEQLTIVREVADSLAIAIHQAQLRQRVEQHATELEARNAELDAFAQTVAHDIQDPLGLVIGFADILVKDGAEISPEEVREYLKIISRTAHKIHNIVHELLLLAEMRHQEIKTHPLEMERIVAQARFRLAHLIEQFDTEISSPDSWPVALGYDPWVEEIWANYLSNAIKYGGRPPRIELGATVAGDQVCFWVRDNGDGVLPQAHEQLFVPFRRFTQARVKGHGLGLSIVQRIVEKLGGQVGVESEGVPGKGSVFSFTLPAARD
ncbi:MAG: response regulator [Anaerolineae bacterium]